VAGVVSTITTRLIARSPSGRTLTMAASENSRVISSLFSTRSPIRVETTAYAGRVTRRNCQRIPLASAYPRMIFRRPTVDPENIPVGGLPEGSWQRSGRPPRR
jgi:hypothetical protein